MKKVIFSAALAVLGVSAPIAAQIIIDWNGELARQFKQAQAQHPVIADSLPGTPAHLEDELDDSWRQSYAGEHPTFPYPGPILEGYTDKISYARGETLNLMVSGSNLKFSVEIARYGQAKEVVYHSEALAAVRQWTPKSAYKNGCAWQPSISFPIPSSWKPGMYAAELRSTGDGVKAPAFLVTFIVKSAQPSARILVLSSVNTWQAYNDWGGASIYRDFRKDHAEGNIFVNFQRPNPGDMALSNEGSRMNGELHVLRWLEKNGYAYDMATDFDFHYDPGLPSAYPVLLINTHSEYWSKEMYDGLVQYLNGGGKLVNLSANSIYCKVTLKGTQMEAHRFGSAVHKQNGEMGGLWRELGRPESSVLGEMFFSGPGSKASAPYAVVNAAHWSLRGTGLKNGDKVGELGLNKFGGGASGWETDQMDSHSPLGTELIARGTNSEKGGAHMLYYRNAKGGEVFSVGSLTFGGSLAVDPKLSQILRNVLQKFGAGSDAGNAVLNSFPFSEQSSPR